MCWILDWYLGCIGDADGEIQREAEGLEINEIDEMLVLHDGIDMM